MRFIGEGKTILINQVTIEVILDSVSDDTESKVQQDLNSLQELGLVVTNLKNIEVSYAGLTWPAYLWADEGDLKFSFLPPVGRLCSDCKNSHCNCVGTEGQRRVLDSCAFFTNESEPDDDDDDDDDGFRW